MPKIGFPMPTDKNRFQILNLHPKIHAFKKNMVLKDKITKKNYYISRYFKNSLVSNNCYFTFLRRSFPECRYCVYPHSAGDRNVEIAVQDF